MRAICHVSTPASLLISCPLRMLKCMVTGCTMCTQLLLGSGVCTNSCQTSSAITAEIKLQTFILIPFHSLYGLPNVQFVRGESTYNQLLDYLCMQIAPSSFSSILSHHQGRKHLGPILSAMIHQILPFVSYTCKKSIHYFSSPFLWPCKKIAFPVSS